MGKGIERERKEISISTIGSTLASMHIIYQ